MPSGVDSVKFVAGVSNQMVVSEGREGCAAAHNGSAVSIPRSDTQVFVALIPRNFIDAVVLPRKLEHASLESFRTGR